MNIYNDESAQGAAEYILLFGAVILIAIAAVVIYRTYFKNKTALKASIDYRKIRGSIK
jgi:hypothetical protein